MRRAAATLTGLMLASPAPAQGDRTCAAAWERLTAVMAVPITADPVTSDGEGWCAVANVGFDSGRAYTPVASADQIRWRAEGIGRFLADLTPPTALDVQISGLRRTVATGDPLLDYLMRVQQGPLATDAQLALRWDAASGVLSLAQFALDFPGDNAVSMTAQIADIDLSSLEAAATSLMSSARLTSLTSEVRSNGLFESAMLMPLGTMLLLGSADPAAEVAALKELAQTEIAALPETVFSTSSRAALLALIDAMPNPAGTLGLRMTSLTGLDATRLMPLVTKSTPLVDDALWAAFDGVTLDVVYTPTPDDQP